MEKFIIIPEDIVQKLREMEFDGCNRLDPIKGEMDGKEVYFLQAELKDNPIFEKVLSDFEECEVKEIATVEYKYYDSRDVLIADVSKIDTSTLACKTLLTEKPIIIDKEIIIEKLK